MSNYLYLETTIHGYTCTDKVAKPWWATVSSGDGPALRSPKSDVQDSGFRVRRCHFLSSIVSAFTISAFQHGLLSAFRSQLSAFSISAFQLFPIGPVVRGRTPAFRFQVSAFQRFNFSARVPSCQRLKSSLECFVMTTVVLTAHFDGEKVQFRSEESR